MFTMDLFAIDQDLSLGAAALLVGLVRERMVKVFCIYEPGELSPHFLLNSVCFSSLSCAFILVARKTLPSFYHISGTL